MCFKTAAQLLCNDTRASSKIIYSVLPGSYKPEFEEETVNRGLSVPFSVQFLGMSHLSFIIIQKKQNSVFQFPDSDPLLQSLLRCAHLYFKFRSTQPDDDIMPRPADAEFSRVFRTAQ